MLAPASRFSKTVATGIRVPRKTHAPLTFPDPSYGQMALREAVKQHLIQGPRIVTAGNFISLTGGHGDGVALAPEWALPRPPNIADTVEEVATAVRRDTHAASHKFAKSSEVEAALIRGVSQAVGPLSDGTRARDLLRDR
jgi:hypothetical protein